MSDFISAIKSAMNDKGMSVSQLAALTGFSRMHIYRLLNGENAPTLDNAELIANALGVKITIESPVVTKI